MPSSRGSSQRALGGPVILSTLVTAKKTVLSFLITLRARRPGVAGGRPLGYLPGAESAGRPGPWAGPRRCPASAAHPPHPNFCQFLRKLIPVSSTLPLEAHSW